MSVRFWSASQNAGGAVAPLVAAKAASRWGWRWAFLVLRDAIADSCLPANFATIPVVKLGTWVLAECLLIW